MLSLKLIIPAVKLDWIHIKKNEYPDKIFSFIRKYRQIILFDLSR